MYPPGLAMPKGIAYRFLGNAVQFHRGSVVRHHDPFRALELDGHLGLLAGCGSQLVQRRPQALGLHLDGDRPRRQRPNLFVHLVESSDEPDSQPLLRAASGKRRLNV